LKKPLNLFYEEPDVDRWFKYDRYPRRVIRRLVRGKLKPGGVGLISLNLMKGLKKIGVPYRFNDYKYIKDHPNEIACIIGKPHVLFDKKWVNPIIFGAGVYSHPIECPNLFLQYPNVKKILVPGEWMQKMFEPFYGDKVIAWPVGIDTDYWKKTHSTKIIDFLIYDKVRWEHEKFQIDLIDPILQMLDEHNLSYKIIRYGTYLPLQLKHLLSQAKAAIFLCEHETQGLAYQQILATDTAILAWDRGGYWQDPYYFPHKVKDKPVSSVPYWDERCGMKFADVVDFEKKLMPFINNLNRFKPRDYVTENLTLEKCAEAYLKIYQEAERELE
jgi:glycosyltransferase involved in cell wall biosynthesis